MISSFSFTISSQFTYDLPPEGAPPPTLCLKNESTRVGKFRVTLTNFSHKRPMNGGPTSASAYVNVDGKGQIVIYRKGSLAPGAPVDHIHSVVAFGYRFYVTSWKYGECVGLVALKLAPKTNAKKDEDGLMEIDGNDLTED